jgi:hypothetical protein
MLRGRSHPVWQNPLRLLSDKARGGSLDAFPGGPALMFVLDRLRGHGCGDDFVDLGTAAVARSGAL